MADRQIIDVAVPGDARVELKEKEKTWQKNGGNCRRSKQELCLLLSGT